LVFTDGQTIRPMVASQDYKRINDGDQGPNTGGMGAISTPDLIDDELQGRILREIAKPTIQAIAEEGGIYRGILYLGLMLTSDGPQVLEYNVRFGDPETQVTLPRLEGSLLEILLAIAEGNLAKIKPQWSSNSTICVVLASGGYPEKYQTGFPISGIEQAEAVENVTVFHAGTRFENGHYFTAGGRVLGVTAMDADIGRAREKAYQAVNEIHFEGKHYRQDIGLDILSQDPK
jgi:phosphoribosylamine--glycine ligase